MATVTPEPIPTAPPNAPPPNGMGIAALIVGIFALIVCWVPALGALLGIVAFVLGILGYRRGGNGQAIAGIVLGALSGILGIVITGTTIVAATHPLHADNGNIIAQWDGETQRMPLPGEPGDTQLPVIKAVDKFHAGVDGTYLVGRDIPAATYSTPGPDPTGTTLCFWQRLSSANGDLGSIISSDITKGSATVAVAPTDYAFKVSGCGGWVKE
jgi:hypothetical protein